jgi:hypothetical protein
MRGDLGLARTREEYAKRGQLSGRAWRSAVAAGWLVVSGGLNFGFAVDLRESSKYVIDGKAICVYNDTKSGTLLTIDGTILPSQDQE